MADKEWAKRRVKAQRDEVAANAKKPDVVAIIQKEAKSAGATLAHGGRGGLDPRVALAAFRRGKWRCSVPDCKTPKEALDLDHPSGHVDEINEDADARKNEKLKDAAARGHSSTDYKAIRCVCRRHHMEFHDRENDIEDGKKPEPVSK